MLHIHVGTENERQPPSAIPGGRLSRQTPPIFTPHLWYKCKTTHQHCCRWSLYFAFPYVFRTEKARRGATRVPNWVTACKLIQGKRLGVHACCMMDLDHGFESNRKKREKIALRLLGADGWTVCGHLWAALLLLLWSTQALTRRAGMLEKCLEGGDQNMPVTLKTKKGETEPYRSADISIYLIGLNMSCIVAHDRDDVSGLCKFWFNRILTVPYKICQGTKWRSFSVKWYVYIRGSVHVKGCKNLIRHFILWNFPDEEDPFFFSYIPLDVGWSLLGAVRAPFVSLYQILNTLI